MLPYGVADPHPLLPETECGFLDPLFPFMLQGVARAGNPQLRAEPSLRTHPCPMPSDQGHYLFRCHLWSPIHWKFPVERKDTEGQADMGQEGHGACPTPTLWLLLE